MVRIIIAGTRSFDNYALLRKTMCSLFGQVPPSQMEIVSGHCPTGADSLGELFARRNNIRLTLFPADWAKYGKAAGPIRNRQMAEYAASDGYCVIFWDGKSRGSRNMAAEAKNAGLKTKIVMYKEDHNCKEQGCGRKDSHAKENY